MGNSEHCDFSRIFFSLIFLIINFYYFKQRVEEKKSLATLNKIINLIQKRHEIVLRLCREKAYISLCSLFEFLLFIPGVFQRPETSSDVMLALTTGVLARKWD